ncbi:hypothetical protein HN51_037188 [Arachis hypogaea]|uniref:helicase-like transcription factor CHR28 isoform X2 n=1 Tax=Arachis ipaensis TaxID=130454 RepID=UPI0007AEEFDA|nr:helicase-like transcription factor CHR28 isoform X2 [Arachis ipaensis]XP_025638164.1 helicase-like transcription factor CHR28 isoform X2 [Arachis hypogaea]QHO02719.1 uncharacterized protein DS421_13g426110 [Arachis hypogaea]
MADDDVNFSELFDGDDDDNMCYIDLTTVMQVLNEDDDPLQSSPEDFSLQNGSSGESGVHDSFQLQNVCQMLEEEPHVSRLEVDSATDCSPFCSDVSDSGAKDSVHFSANPVLEREHENQGLPSQACSSTEKTGLSKFETSSFGMETSFPEAYSNNVSVCQDYLNKSMWKSGNERQFKHVGEDVESEHASHSSIIENGDLNFEDCVEDAVRGAYGQQESDLCTSFQISDMEADDSLHASTSIDSALYQGSHFPSDLCGDYAYPNYHQGGTYDRSFANDPTLRFIPNGIGSKSWTNKEMMTNLKAENMEFCTDMAQISGGMHSVNTGGSSIHDSQFTLADSGYSSYFSGNSAFEDGVSVALSTYASHGDQSLCMKAEGDKLVTSYQNNFQNNDAQFNIGQEVKQLPDLFPSVKCKSYGSFPCEDSYTVITSDRANHYQDTINGTASKLQRNMVYLTVDQCLPHAHASIAVEQQFGCVKRGGTEMIQHNRIDSHHSKRTAENFRVEDTDVCIIEDNSHPVPTSQSEAVRNSLSIFQSSGYVGSQHYAVGSTRVKACDERNILQVALQDLSQPKSEISLPVGLLAVPLLRHQRIALSWMVQKETSSLYCSGGILADDQGLGKTVSTIALILKERPPKLSACPNAQNGELETLNLDGEDDGLPQSSLLKKESDSCGDMSIRDPIKSKSLSLQTKGRPSAGTLIVCPTSVLRQWAEELHNKVTSQANLSVLVYHGSNRTKDPHEVAKYDVVLTTYSIVSMEVPKQPLADKEDEEKGIFEDSGVPNRKRKNPSNSSKSGKKRLDNALLEAAARPLAKVSWFRVVLDEAQSIKNHRTQVARACSGLRAKRRWCLSGTPIQNAIDDLYSYFRFLRYAPYDIYTSFCSMIKNQVSRNPTKGYKKIQAVLKTIMLRRTKGTFLDGEPIISLPPKFVELKKVEFSMEERDFYSKLEADSRAQFQEYADAGTVKQNYVNILLMLLRLRQACDHPLLVKRYNSNTLWRSSVEMAKKLPQEKQVSLLKCLEASLALCGICNDPPEDAVVSVCGHVFCSQCISEHLTGDDNQCPAANCKSRLSMSTVFAKAMLNGCMSNQGCDSSPGSSGSEVDESEPWSRSQPYDSSKIKAALEVLKSLSRVQCITPKVISAHGTPAENTECPGVSCDVNNGKRLEDIPESQHLSGNSSSNGTGEKAIVFSQWTRMLDLLEVCLKQSSIQYRRLDGTMSVIARDKAVKDFNTLPEVSVMIMSLKAASLGLNMVAACHVLMLDLWWNPTTEDQAIDRAHRIGQTRPVTVLRLTVKDTVEDRILALQQKKRKMVASAFGEDGTGGRQSRLTVDDLKYLFMM